jgi:hypothetical protein
MDTLNPQPQSNSGTQQRQLLQNSHLPRTRRGKRSSAAKKTEVMAVRPKIPSDHLVTSSEIAQLAFVMTFQEVW